LAIASSCDMPHGQTVKLATWHGIARNLTTRLHCKPMALKPPTRLAELNGWTGAPVALDELRTGSVYVPEPPIEDEPTEAHDRAVVAALYSRAVGYTRSKQVLNNKGDAVDLTEDLPPDTAAAVRWLASRRPDQWGEKRQEQVRVVIDRLGDGRERIGVSIGRQGGEADMHVIEAGSDGIEHGDSE